MDGAPDPMAEFVPWSAAMQQALYGPSGFYRRAEGPLGHFRTSAGASPLFAEALVAMLSRVDAALDGPRTLDFVDVGAGRGELLLAVRSALPPSMRMRVRLFGVDLADRPASLPADVGWRHIVPTGIVGLLTANELLDNVPFTVVEVDDSGTARQMLVQPRTGAERPGPPVTEEDLAWLHRWWPLQAGERAEVGLGRDRMWAQLVQALSRGVAVAIDYATDRATRVAGGCPNGTVTAYRAGRQVAPVPDGSCDITAAVALDACAEAGAAAGAQPCGTAMVSQRTALRSLLPPPGTAPPAEAAAHTLARLRRNSELAELCDPEGLGGFTWLLHSCGSSDPTAFLTPVPRAEATSKRSGPRGTSGPHSAGGAASDPCF